MFNERQDLLCNAELDRGAATSLVFELRYLAVSMSSREMKRTATHNLLCCVYDPNEHC